MELTNTFRNPILPGFNPDPSICHVPGKGYFLGTSTFEFFPGLPVYHSTDLVNWKLIGHAVNRRSQGVDMRTIETSAGLWAPTLRYHMGKWYMVCACFWRLRTAPSGERESIPSGFYVSTDDIFDDSKWSEAVYFDEVGFDQDLFFDEDKVYHAVTRWGNSGKNGRQLRSWVNEIDVASGRSLTEPVMVRESPTGVAEGCHIIKLNGYYYLFVAEGGTNEGHRECVFRGSSPIGPYEEPPAGINPLIFNGDHPDIRNTGHMDIVQAENGKWYAVFLGVRPKFKPSVIYNGGLGMASHLGRETFMAPMEWVDGWPVVNGGKQVDLVVEAPGLSMQPAPTVWQDDFKGSNLDIGWYHLRTPLKSCYNLTERGLALYGSAVTLNIEHCPAMLLRKQTMFELDWSTQMDFTPSKPGQEAGAVVWMTKTAHAVVAVRGTQGGVELVFRSPNDNDGLDEQIIPLKTTGPITFSIKARTLMYEFSYTLAGDTVVVGTMPSRSLQPRFTGVHLGIYAQGVDDTPCISPAHFKYVRIEPVSVK